MTAIFAYRAKMRKSVGVSLLPEVYFQLLPDMRSVTTSSMRDAAAHAF